MMSLVWTTDPWVGALLGAGGGSFVGYLSFRVPRGLPWISPVNSSCPNCQAPIALRDQVPVLSWVWLMRRCRSCRSEISWRYPVIELVGAFVGAGLLGIYHATATAAGLGLLAIICLAISVVDLECHRIPRLFTHGLLAAAIVQVALGGMTPHSCIIGLLFGLALSGIGELLGGLWKWRTGNAGFGRGDTHLLIAACAMLGADRIQSFFLIEAAILGACLVILTITRRATMVPAGPLLTAALFVAALPPTPLGSPICNLFAETACTIAGYPLTGLLGD